jgi:hypothetical protein
MGQEKQASSNQITRSDGGRTTEMTYSADQMKNPRQTPEGRSADAKARSGTFAETGRDASHRHSLSGNAPAGDKGNMYAGNSIQNRAGGTKQEMERDRDAQVKADPSVSVKERSTMLQKDGSGQPIGEKVEQSTYRDGKMTGEKREVIFGNFPSSSSRHADAAKAQGQQPDKKEMSRLVKVDRENLRAQGNGTTKQAQAQAKEKGEMER